MSRRPLGVIGSILSAKIVLDIILCPAAFLPVLSFLIVIRQITIQNAGLCIVIPLDVKVFTQLPLETLIVDWKYGLNPRVKVSRKKISR